ncbi:hypothetical protein I79_022149 [Cricetulus griseus]|uniref:Uncharacterized protein n=1 Tax=Cricetulus griseus TaxID=10029 RepID=G3IEK2_CRIGR|nr:hypothetical protein I79_022149 [Cricetulus griseus]
MPEMETKKEKKKQNKKQPSNHSEYPQILRTRPYKTNFIFGTNILLGDSTLC